VLSPFTPAEVPLADEAIHHAVEAIEKLFRSV
jgi:hypothetical protein